MSCFRRMLVQPHNQGRKAHNLQGLPVDKPKLYLLPEVQMAPPALYILHLCDGTMRQNLSWKAPACSMVREDLQVPEMRLAAEEGKAEHTWAGWWGVDRTNSRYPEGEIWMQGVGTEDVMSLDPCIQTQTYTGPFNAYMNIADSFTCILSHTFWRRIFSAFQIQMLWEWYKMLKSCNKMHYHQKMLLAKPHGKHNSILASETAEKL